MKLVVTNRCVKNPRHLSHVMKAVGTTLMTRVAHYSTTHLSRRRKPKKMSVIRELGVWEVIDRPHDEVLFGTRWVDINSGDETKPFYRSRSCKSKSVKQTGHFSQLHLESLRRLLICAPIDELPNGMVQSVAWTEPVVLMLTDVRRAHFCSAARRKVFVELPAEAVAGKTKVGRLLKSMYGCRDAAVTWEFAICKVIVAIGLVQVCSSRLHRQCHMVLLETARWRIEEFLDHLDTTTVYKASECLAGSWNGLLKASLGRQTPDILNSSGNRSA